MRNPCFSCEMQGCGNHANCERYMSFYNHNRKIGEERAKLNPADYIEQQRNRRIKIRKGEKP